MKNFNQFITEAPSKLSHSAFPDAARFLSRNLGGKKYKATAKMYLDLLKKQKKIPKSDDEKHSIGVKAAKIMGVDFRNFEKVFHDLVKKGDIPMSLAWLSEDVINTLEPLNESTKLTKTEEQFLSKFVKNPKTEVKVVHYRGTGQIRGGGPASGKKDYDLAMKLVQKKVLSIVKKEKTSPYHNQVIVKLTNPDMPIGLKLTKKQESVLWSIKRANELVKKGREWGDFRHKMFTQNDQENIFDQLRDMGLVDFKHYELPKITKSGASIVGT